jgi:hypothetical protein
MSVVPALNNIFVTFLYPFRTQHGERTDIEEYLDKKKRKQQKYVRKEW